MRRICLSLSLCLLTALQVLAQTREADVAYAAFEKCLEKYGMKDTTCRVCQNFCDLCVTPELQQTARYAEALCFLARAANKSGNVTRAIEIGQRAADIRDSIPVDALFRAESHNEMGIYYSRLGNYDEAIRHGEEAERIFVPVYGKNKPFYGTIVGNLAVYYSARRLSGDDQKAVTMAESALKVLKTKTESYVNTLSSLSVYYSRVGNFKKSNAASKKSIAMGKKVFGETSYVYAGTLQNLASNSGKAGDYEQAVRFAEEARNIYEKTGQTETLRYAQLLYNLALYKEECEQYETIPSLLIAAREIFVSVEGEASASGILCISKMSDTYHALGDLEKALKYARESEQLREQQANANQGNWTLAHVLSEQGKSHSAAGDYAKAIELENQALRIYESLAVAKDIASSLNILSNYHALNDDNPTALDLANRAIETLGGQDEDYQLKAHIHNNLCTYHYNMEAYADAAANAEKAVAFFTAHADTLSSEFALMLSNHALILYMLGDTDAAITEAERAVSIHQDVFGEKHPDGVTLLYNLAAYNQHAGREELAKECFYQALHVQMDYVRSNFSHFTISERERFWGIMGGILSKTYDYALRHSDATDAAEAYNAALFAKGLLLNSEVDFRQLLLKSNNDRLIVDYNRIATLRNEINTIYRAASGNTKSKSEIDIRKREMAEIERRLIKECKAYGDFTSNLSVDYRDVQRTLPEDAVAIEFATSSLRNGDKAYMAICLRPGDEAPEIIRLFDQAQLDTLCFNSVPFAQALAYSEGINAVYNSKKVGDLVWKPLLDTLGNEVREVYFSPTGVLHQLGIEYLPVSDSLRIFDRFALHRLSSTKSLTMQNDCQQKQDQAAVYGGLYYSLTAEDLAQDDEKYKANGLTERLQATRGKNGLALYLPGTLTEAEFVAEQLMQHGISTRVFLEEEGTERSFKSLVDDDVSILHIATHGFFFSSDVVEQNRESLLFLQEDVVGDNSMNNTGLLFAGSNLVMSGETIPSDVENGVLTAKEISRLDFKNLDLVVLSACQTGLGEIKDDGVFGLQRGFKMAGAKCLLMSLWSVSDHATELLMRTFYSEYLAGRSSTEALSLAQKNLREQGFEEPIYWASFVLLDAGER